MKDVQNISAEEIVNENPVKAEKSENLVQIKDKMEENGVLAVPIVEDGKLLGAIGYRDLIRHIQFNPQKTKLEKLMHQPPEFDTGNNMVDLASLRLNSGRKMLVHTEGDKLKGVIGEQEFLKGLDQAKQVENISTRDIATYDVITAFEDDPLDKARHVLLDNNISRLPVLNDEGNLVGQLSSLDVLKMIVPRESMGPGGTSQMKQKEMQGGEEKHKMSDISVEEIMDRTPTLMEGHGTSKEAVEKMIDEGSTEVLITDRKFPEAIITVKDFLQHLEDRYNYSDTVLVNLIGVEVAEEKAAIHDKVSTQLKGSLGRKLDNPEELSLHVKKSEKDGKKHRYELVAKLYSEFGITTSNVEEWELMDAVDTALDELNTQVRKKKEKQEEKR